jgi:VanZ family protein
MRQAVVVYAFLLFYGSLYPFQWAARGEPLFAFLLHPGDAYLGKVDLVQNVLVYMPFGLLLAVWWARRHRHWTALPLAVAAGTLFSVCAEIVQLWLPARVSSAADVAMNLLGTLCGALLAGLLRRDTHSGARLQGWRDGWFARGAIANTGLVVVALWLLSQISPLIPVFGLGRWKQALMPVYFQLRGYAPLSPAMLFSLACNFTALGLLLRALIKPGKPWWRLHGALLLAVLAGQFLIEGHALRLEEVAAALLSLPLLALVLALVRGPAQAAAQREQWMRSLRWMRWPRQSQPDLATHAEPAQQAMAAACAAIALLALAMAASELTPAYGNWRGGGFNWVPFRGHMRSLQGFTNILEFLWPFMAMAWLARQVSPPARHHAIAVSGGLALALLMFAMEWMQLRVPGRSADITQVMLACAGWAAPWLVEEWVLAHPPAARAAA